MPDTENPKFPNRKLLVWFIGFHIEYENINIYHIYVIYIFDIECTGEMRGQEGEKGVEMLGGKPSGHGL